MNMVSAALDNATLAAAEISLMMVDVQIKAILTGNIPNIISACKINIGSRVWAKFGVPLGITILAVYYLLLFIL
jgi:predicted cation transporter